MGKLDIGVGDEFPVDEPPPPNPEDTEAVRAAREEWEKQRDEWRQHKDEWRAQRQAFREDMRARRDAFKADVRKSAREHFGDMRHYGWRIGRGSPFVLRLVVLLGIVALAIALLPFLMMFGMIVLAAAAFFFAGRHSSRGDYPPGNANPSR